MNASTLATKLLTTYDDGHDFFDRGALAADLTVENMGDLADTAVESRVELGIGKAKGGEMRRGGMSAVTLNKLRTDSAFADEVAGLLFKQYQQQKADFLASRNDA